MIPEWRAREFSDRLAPCWWADATADGRFSQVRTGSRLSRFLAPYLSAVFPAWRSRLVQECRGECLCQQDGGGGVPLLHLPPPFPNHRASLAPSLAPASPSNSTAGREAKTKQIFPSSHNSLPNRPRQANSVGPFDPKIGHPQNRDNVAGLLLGFAVDAANHLPIENHVPAIQGHCIESPLDLLSSQLCRVATHNLLGVLDLAFQLLVARHHHLLR